MSLEDNVNEQLHSNNEENNINHNSHNMSLEDNVNEQLHSDNENDNNNSNYAESNKPISSSEQNQSINASNQNIILYNPTQTNFLGNEPNAYNLNETEVETQGNMMYLFHYIFGNNNDIIDGHFLNIEMLLMKIILKIMQIMMKLYKI